MADNNVEIERLRREIQRVNSEISQLEREYESRLTHELEKIKSEFAQSATMQQQDFSTRFKKLEKSLCDAYLYETDKMRQQYEALVEQVNSYESELGTQIQQIVQDHTSFLKHKEAEDAQACLSAQQSIQQLKQNIQAACQVPVDLFYPRALQRYIDAGTEAEKLLQSELYSLAFAKADCACMSVARITDETASKVRELESMFQLYRAKLDAIDEFIASTESRQLIDRDEIILELSEIDLDYWSDVLYTDLQTLLHKHKAIVNNGIDSWLAQCQGAGISPSLLLDKEIQKLDLIPKKLSVCMSYALSSCDCYNYLTHIKSIADQVLLSQNYSFNSIQFGAVKHENSSTNGYAYYYDNYLSKELCVDSSSKPDYREERVLIYEKSYDVGKKDECKLYVIPIRKRDTVAIETYIQFNTDYLPISVSQNIRNLFLQSGLNVKLLSNNDQIPIQSDRQLSLDVLNNLSSDEKEATLSSKYSVNI